MSEVQPPQVRLTDGQIHDVLERAVKRLAAMAPGISILLPEPVNAAKALADCTPTGWCQIGVLRDARNRFWYRVLWHPETGSGRLLREKPKAKRDAMGRCLPTPPMES